MRNITLIAVLLISCSSSGQKKKYYFRFIDSETNIPVESVFVSTKYGPGYGKSDENGEIRFKTFGLVDTFESTHVSYKQAIFSITNQEIYLERDTLRLGKLYYYQYTKPANLKCYKSNNIPPAKFDNLVNERPKYNGGLLCFDNYIYESLKNASTTLDYKSLKKINIIFTLTADGFVSKVYISSDCNEDIQNLIKKIFMDCPRWIPSRQYDEYYSMRCRYIIDFRK